MDQLNKYINVNSKLQKTKEQYIHTMQSVKVCIRNAKIEIKLREDSFQVEAKSFQCSVSPSLPCHPEMYL